jgi:predicted dehydrogenase
VGLVGAGYMANHYIKLFDYSSLYTIVGIVSRTKSKAELLVENLKGASVYRTIKEMYEAATPDVVIVAVPILETFGVLREVWNYPWTCIVEKPAGYNLSEAQMILGESRSCPGATFLALNRRYYESVQGAKDLLSHQDGPKFIQVYDQHDTEVAREAGAPMAVLANWHFANAIHTVDLANFFASGVIESVTSSRWTLGSKSFVVEASVDYSSGDRIAYTSYWNTPQNWSLSISTSETRALLSPLEELQTQAKGNRLPTRTDLEGKDKIFKPGLFGLVENLTSYLQGKPSEMVSLEESLESMNLVERIFGSAPSFHQGQSS